MKFYKTLPGPQGPISKKIFINSQEDTSDKPLAVFSGGTGESNQINNRLDEDDHL